MTEQDERLQRAWLALCGWRVGMVTMDGVPVQSWWLEDPTAGYKLKDRRPALDSPANWGHWLAWLVDASDPCTVFVEAGDGGWRASAGSPTGLPARFPDTLLGAWMLYCEEQGTDEDQPPEVREWWQHETAREDGGD